MPRNATPLRATEVFQTTRAGLDAESFPMRLYEKAKRLGTWDPCAIDLSRDRNDWARLAPREQTVIFQLTSLFQAGEEAVTLDLLPLVLAIASEGVSRRSSYRVIFEEELPLDEVTGSPEGKHTQFFRRFRARCRRC